MEHNKSKKEEIQYPTHIQNNIRSSVKHAWPASI